MTDELTAAMVTVRMFGHVPKRSGAFFDVFSCDYCLQAWTPNFQTPVGLCTGPTGGISAGTITGYSITTGTFSLPKR